MQTASYQDATAENDDREHTEMEPGVHPELGGQRADAATGQTAHRPHAVHAGHDGSLQPQLQVHGMGVHHHVAHAGGHAVQHEDRKEPGHAWSQRGQRDRGAPEREQDPRGGPPPEPITQPAGQRHTDERPNRRTEQHKPQHPWTEMQILLNPRQPRGQTPRHRPMHHEDGRDGPPMTHARPPGDNDPIKGWYDRAHVAALFGTAIKVTSRDITGYKPTSIAQGITPLQPHRVAAGGCSVGGGLWKLLGRVIYYLCK